MGLVKRRRSRREKVRMVVLTVIAVLSALLFVTVLVILIIKSGWLLSTVETVSSDAPFIYDLGFTDDYNTQDSGDTTQEETRVPTGAEPQLLSTVSDANSISLEWVDTGLGEYSILYKKCDNASEKHGKEYREDKSEAMANICSSVFDAEDDGTELEANGWLRIPTNDTRISLSGLEPGAAYHIHIVYTDEREGQYIDGFDASTTESGYGDPFKSAHSLFRSSERDENTGVILSLGETYTVQMTSSEGCQNAVVKPMFDIGMYGDTSLSEDQLVKNVAKGSKLIISADEGNNYCYYDAADGYRLYVTDEEGQSGWIEARRVLIDMNRVFAVSSMYSMQFDRTNAYSSIFTAGGDARNVELDSESTDTRYNPLLLGGDKSQFMTTTGYNGIDGVTGLELYNYESPEYMPVIWDLALELKQCQKNALENGYTIKMYEGYRPLSTSELVYNNLLNSGSLALVVGDTNLAQGYIVGQSYNVGYYIGIKSRHNRGVATDLTLVRINANGAYEEAHMQTKMHTLDFRCNMYYNTWEADLLTDIMIGHGSNLEYLAARQEWWHFQLRNDRKDLYPLVESYGYEDFKF